MVGRRRRGSTSSVEATSRRPVHWYQEASVLRAPAPGTSDDDWPIFELRDAVVLNKDGQTMENALDMLFKGPFIVRGNMVVDDPEQKLHLIMRVRSSIPIEIPACTSYSVGEVKDDADEEDIDPRRRSRPPVLWLGGYGAWFEINPSAAYLSIYRTICEAIRLYYAIYDIYADKGAKSLNRVSKSTDPVERLSEVFLQYSIKVGNGLTVEEVAQRCRDLAPFLINQFLQSKAEEQFWQETFFYRWIKKEHEDLYKRARQAIRNPSKATMIPTIQELPSRSKRGPSESNNEGGFVSRSQEPATRNRSTRSRSTGSGAQDSAAKSSGADESSTSGHKKARSRSNLQHTAQPEQIGRPAPAQNSAGGTTALPTPRGDQGAFDILLEVLDWAYGELAPTKTGITMSKLLNKLYFAFKFPNFKNGQTGCHRIPVEEVIHYNASTLIDTLDASKWGDHDFYAELQKMAKTELKPIALKPSDFPYFIVPRSRSSKQPGASSQPSQAAAIVVGGSSHQDGNNDTSFEGFETPKRAGKGVKTPGRLGKSSLRPAASSKKRPRSDVDSDSESESRDAKRSHYFYDTDDTMDDADTNGHGLRDEDEDQVKIVLRADKIPSTVPHGPDGTWTCDQEDCNYIVRGGDAEECQERIRQHFKGHEQQTERVQLAVTESRGHLPINHLLDKIKYLGDRAQKQEELSVGGIPLPPPIQRKLVA